MKVLVAYMSLTGNTRMVAQAMFDAITVAKEIKELGEINTIEGYDLVFVGFPMHGVGQPADEAGAFIERHCQGRDIALFVTHASGVGFPLLDEWLANCRAAAAGANLLGMFDCQGRISDEQLDLLRSDPSPEAKDIASRVVGSFGHPDEQELEAARAFATEMVDKARGD